jgi:deferrochelatase/peroxidase EfeB
MISQMDLGDIQGNIVKAYGRYGFPVARYVFYRVNSAEVGRQFVTDLMGYVTTSAPWTNPAALPLATTNIAFTYEGLKHLDVPDDTLHGFPDEFSMGMKARRDIIGDTGPSHFSRWDPIWNLESSGETQPIHILISINARTEHDAEGRYQRIRQVLDAAIKKWPDVRGEEDGVMQLSGHRGPGGGEHFEYQPSAALTGRSDKEHFGYSDGISGTFFRGCGEDPTLVIGGGKPTGKDPRTKEGWEPLEPGEFILGQPDESGAYPEAPGPPLFSRNGTYLVYRKLHQNVASFYSYLEDEGSRFPGGKEALAAKLVGRWRNGAPLTRFPTEAEADAFVNEVNALQKRVWAKTATPAERTRLDDLKLQYVAFDYVDDHDGARCPFGSHTRRTNPRSALQFAQKGSFGKPAFQSPAALTNRRRILRRGLPYGAVEERPTDAGDHGVIIIILNADLSRQFEFVQQQWVNFGNDFKLANDRDPLIGNHGVNENGRASGRMVIEGDATTSTPPYFCSRMPTLVETRGGDYFFVPSLTCLRMIGLGIVDPT